MTTPRPFAQIDVFTAQPGYGNPVAVVLDGSGLDDAAMQRFARWTVAIERAPLVEERTIRRVEIFRLAVGIERTRAKRDYAVLLVGDPAGFQAQHERLCQLIDTVEQLVKENS